MSNVIYLLEHKEKKYEEQYFKYYYLENYKAIPEYIINYHECKQKKIQKDSERKMQLAYMKLLTKMIENN